MPRFTTGSTTSRTSTFPPSCACPARRRSRARAASRAAARRRRRRRIRCAPPWRSAPGVLMCSRCSTSTGRWSRRTSSNTSCGCACGRSRWTSGRLSWRRWRGRRRAGYRVLLLTGALDVVVEPLAELLEVEVDCARLLVKDGRLTGDLEAPPPAGEARGVLLEEYASRNGLVLADSFAYADSLSDLPMLELVSTPVAVNPDARLSQVAGQRGWRVERWKMAPGNWRLPMPDPRSPEYKEAVRR